MIFLRIIGFLVGAIMAVTASLWSVWFFIGLIIAAICGITFLPDLIDLIIDISN